MRNLASAIDLALPLGRAAAACLLYDGEYREVTFGEAIPTVEHRPAWMTATLSLASDASVTRFLRVVGESSGYGALCGGLGDVYCSITPRWIRFDAPPRGESLLIAMRAKVERGSIDGDRLAVALLDEAHRAMRGEPPLPLDALLVGDTLLPNGLDSACSSSSRCTRGVQRATARTRWCACSSRSTLANWAVTTRMPRGVSRSIGSSRRRLICSSTVSGRRRHRC
jgi:hypothetical protein